MQHGTDGAENPPWRHCFVFELVRSLMSTLTPGGSASLVNTQAGCRLFIQLLDNDDDDDDDDVVRTARMGPRFMITLSSHQRKAA